jgi:ubiquinone/menaquinone biosynthesis C-methylase UbiE
MSSQSRPYAIHSDTECDRLERQAVLAGLEEHLAMLKGLPPLTSILDVGCGSGSMAHLPFEDGAFDLVWSKYVLQWLKEPAPAVAELRRVTSPGGSVICSTFDGFAVTHWPEDPIFKPMRSVYFRDW